jgi:hypothetical protein
MCDEKPVPPYDGDLKDILRHAINKSRPITTPEGKKIAYRMPVREVDRLKSRMRQDKGDPRKSGGSK